jgi:TonB family protein
MLAPFFIATSASAAAAAVAGAVALSPAALISDPGYRDIELRTNGSRASGEVIYALTIDPAGRIEGCKVVDSSGSTHLDSLSCLNARRNLRFSGARDDAGRPAYSVVRQRIVWSEGFVSTGARSPGVDVILKVGRMPKEWARAPGIRVDYIVGADGTVTSCVPASDMFVSTAGADGVRSSQPSLKDARMARAACAALPGAVQIEVVRDRTGQAVPSVQSANVVFEESSAAVTKG